MLCADLAGPAPRPLSGDDNTLGKDFAAPNTPRLFTFDRGAQASLPDRAGTAQRLRLLELIRPFREPQIGVGGSAARQDRSGGRNRSACGGVEFGPVQACHAGRRGRHVVLLVLVRRVVGQSSRTGPGFEEEIWFHNEGHGSRPAIRGLDWAGVTELLGLYPRTDADTMVRGRATASAVTIAGAAQPAAMNAVAARLAAASAAARADGMPAARNSIILIGVPPPFVSLRLPAVASAGHAPSFGALTPG